MAAARRGPTRPVPDEPVVPDAIEAPGEAERPRPGCSATSAARAVGLDFNALLEQATGAAADGRTRSGRRRPSSRASPAAAW